MDPILIEDGEPESGSGGDPASTMILPLWRSRLLIAGMVVLGAGLGLFLGIMQPNSYQSDGKLVLRWGLREEMSPETMLSDLGSFGRGQPRDAVNNELHLLRAPQVFERTAELVTPAALFATYDPTEDDDESTPQHIRLLHRAQAWWFSRPTSDPQGGGGHEIDGCDGCISMAADLLQQRIDLHAELGSTVIMVSFVAHDPLLARRVVQCFLQAAEERHREVYDTSEELALIREDLMNSEAEKAAAELEFAEFKVNCEVYDWTTQRTEAMQSIRALQQDILDDELELSRLEGRRDKLEEQIETTDKEVLQLVAGVPAPNPEYVETLKDVQRNREALEELELSKEYVTDTDRTKMEEILQGRIDKGLERLARTEKLIGGEAVEQLVQNQHHAYLVQIRDQVLQDIEALNRAMSPRTLALQQEQEARGDIEGCGPEFQELENRVRMASNAVERFRKEFDSLQRMSRLDELDISNLTRMQDATLPRDKVGPKRAKVLVVGVLLGFMGGAALGFIRNLLNPTVRTPADVRRILGLHIVGVLPRSGLSRRLQRAMRRAAL